MHNPLGLAMLSAINYTVKKVSDFPVPIRDVTNQTLPGQELFNYSRPGRVWLVGCGRENYNPFFTM
jgi:hypothetical protein